MQQFQLKRQSDKCLDNYIRSLSFPSSQTLHLKTDLINSDDWCLDDQGHMYDPILQVL